MKHKSTSIRISEKKLLDAMYEEGIYSYGDLSERLSLSRNAVQNCFAQNEGFFSRVTAVHIASFFGKDISDLIYVETEEAEEAPEIEETVEKTDERFDAINARFDALEDLITNATAIPWRDANVDSPKCDMRTPKGNALHSRYVLVRSASDIFFVATMWVRDRDGAKCWKPTFTIQDVDVQSGDRWLPLSFFEN